MTEEAPNLTPANAVNNRQELRPLPLRVAHSQYIRLTDARNRTGISVQEHVRRAVDIYLNSIEREAIELGHLSAPKPPQQSGRLRTDNSSTRGAGPSKLPAPKVVRR